MRLKDDRYLFHLPPWAFFLPWLAAGVALGWLLQDAPLWLRIVIVAPVGWTMPFYVSRMIIRMPVFERIAERRQIGASRSGDGSPDQR